jgi:hypothetical protein
VRRLDRYSGVGAVARATIGEVRACPQARQLLSELMEEVLAVAHARGIQLGEDVITRTLVFVESLPASGTASMQRDIVDGRRSELEEIIGAVVRLGDQRGIRLRRWIAFTPRFCLRYYVPGEGLRGYCATGWHRSRQKAISKSSSATSQSLPAPAMAAERKELTLATSNANVEKEQQV